MVHSAEEFQSLLTSTSTAATVQGFKARHFSGNSPHEPAPGPGWRAAGRAERGQPCPLEAKIVHNTRTRLAALRSLTLFLLICCPALVLSAAEPSPDRERIAVAVEALTRIQNVDLSTNATLKAAVGKVLTATRGTPAFVDLIKHFQIKDQNLALLEIALKNPVEPAAIEAIRWILATGDKPLLNDSLNQTNQALVLKTVEALGQAGQPQAVPFLEPLLISNRPPEVRRAAVSALAQSQEGCRRLLALAREQRLPDSLAGTARAALHSARWPDIQREAADLLPLPQTRNAEPLPPLRELAQRTGDAARGALVFSRPDVGCINCHQVHNAGVNFGPDLSEIGGKLAREAIYESILDPNAGISFGYESYELALESGDEAYGLMVSETADEIALKDTRGIVTRYKKSEIKQKRQLPISAMPAGLQQNMAVEDLIDLVEYLSSLKKK